MNSLSVDNKAVWRIIRKELKGIGISVATFDVNRSFIFDWFARAVEAGAFEEKNAHSTDNKSQYIDEQECEISEVGDGGDMWR